ncbi:ARM repeat-containing protein [Auriculariales sp. MPI-PUGE-AT-0066]|nr:ARM repeat-containing protein [Auriculariales sp. MPI-PUGE-AT-0066]
MASSYSCFPTLPVSDVEQATLLIQRAYGAAGTGAEEQRALQAQLFELQKRPEAWGLVVPLLSSADPNIAFFGAHTAQVKVARDWESIPDEQREIVRDAMLDIVSRASLADRPRPVLRKLFVALTSLALRLAPHHPSRWPGWLVTTANNFVARGIRRSYLLEFLVIAAEECTSADLFGPTKIRMHQTLYDTAELMVSMVTRASGSDVAPAMKCLSAWITFGMPSDYLTPLVPFLINLLNNPETFVPAVDALDALLSSSAFSSGAGTKTLTEPLLAFLNTHGPGILQGAITAAQDGGSIEEVPHSLARLVAALGDHSVSYVVRRLADPQVQGFLRLVLGFQSFPGYFNVDEEVSELVLPFWYLLQEALWDAGTSTTDFGSDSGGGTEASEHPAHVAAADLQIAQALYVEVVAVLRKKATWPPMSDLQSWTRDQRDKFVQYRRDIGDSLVNAYYVLRDKMANSLVDVVAQETARTESHSWEEAESALHCIAAIQEGVPLAREKIPILSRLFAPEVLGRLPSTGADRVRLTMLGCIGSYATWFPAQDSTLLLGVVNYVASAIHEPTLCLSAANALKELCDANRSALAPHVSAFGELYGRLGDVPDTERNKVLQSIASVLQALPPLDGVIPVESIIAPIVQRLAHALDNAASLPEDGRPACITELEALAGCARGLTSQNDTFFVDEGDAEETNEMERSIATMEAARVQPRAAALRDAIMTSMRKCVTVWAEDIAVSGALGDVIKAITALPTDQTIITLPPVPLLELVATAATRKVTSIWLGIAGMLIGQMNPPSPTTLKVVPTDDARAFVSRILPALIDPTMRVLAGPDALASEPDVAQSFFKFLLQVATNFVWSIYELDALALNAVMQCSISALSLQEKYSLQAACNFLLGLLQQSLGADSLEAQIDLLIRTYGRPLVSSLLYGIAGAAPRSATPNLADLLSKLISARSELCRMWMTEVLFSEGFENCKADADARERFLKALMSSRSSKRTRESATQFAVVARGLDNSAFGYATVTM